MNFYTTEQIGPKRFKTPEGFLLCRDVVIARTGVQDYGAYELDPKIPLGNDGKIHVLREEREVFRPETIDSFSGKSVVIDHPSSDVVPENWRELTVGVVLNPRRGEGDQKDFLVADFLITDPAAIALIESDEIKEVSCGYDAKYIVRGPGDAVQRTIVGNHVALVEKARCGSVCSIQDHATRDCCDEEETSMTWKEKLLKAIKGKDEGTAIALLEEVPEDGKTATTIVNVHTRDEEEKKKDDEDDDKDKEKKTHDAIKNIVTDAVKPIRDSIDALDVRMKKMEDAADEDDPDDKKDDDKDDKTKDAAFLSELPEGMVASKVKDSKPFEESFQETVALAEIISPGIAIPTFDSKDKPRKTFDSICAFRRKVLDKAAAEQEDVKEFMGQVLGGRNFKTYDCSGVRTVFQAVGVFKKKANNSVRDGGRVTLFGNAPMGKIKSIADINSQNREFFKNG